MHWVPNRSFAGLSGIDISGSEATYVVQMVLPPEVDWAAFSTLMMT